MYHAGRKKKAFQLLMEWYLELQNLHHHAREMNLRKPNQ